MVHGGQPMWCVFVKGCRADVGTGASMPAAERDVCSLHVGVLPPIKVPSRPEEPMTRDETPVSEAMMSHP